jgi:nitrite reductase/ring-hydroxylating ferredoxin subunit
MTDPRYTPVAAVTDVAPDTVKVVVAGGRSILIVHHGGRLFAIENRCSHAEQPIECGRVRYGWIACPAHGAKFDLETGDALTAPATTPIATFPIRVVGDRIEVAL